MHHFYLLLVPDPGRNQNIAELNKQPVTGPCYLSAPALILGREFASSAKLPAPPGVGQGQ